jgi:hypothetical protein
MAFQESIFAGENAQNSRLNAKLAFNSRRVYHPDLNGETVRRKAACGRYENRLAAGQKQNR